MSAAKGGVGVLLTEFLAGDFQGCRIEIVDRGCRAGLSRPVLVTGLTAYLLDLLEIQSTKRVSVPTVEVSLPCDWHALGRGWNLEHHQTALRQLNFVDFLERDSARRLLCDLLFEAIEVRTMRAILTADDFARLVLDTEDEPASRFILQVRLVAKRHEVFAEVVEVKIQLRFFELHPFRFCGELEKLVEFGFEFGLGHGSFLTANLR